MVMNPLPEPRTEALEQVVVVPPPPQPTMAAAARPPAPAPRISTLLVLMGLSSNATAITVTFRESGGVYQ